MSFDTINPTVSKVLQEMQRRYSPPREVDTKPDMQKEVLGLLGTDLAKFDEKLLEAIWEKLPFEYRGRTWPRISDFGRVADKVELRLSSENARRLPKQDSNSLNHQFAERQMSSDEARIAAEGGFARGFYDFCAEYKTIPTPDDLERIRTRTSQRRQAMWEKVKDEPASSMGRKIFETMMDRERALQEKVGVIAQDREGVAQ